MASATTGSDFFRLIKLSRGRWDDEIHCTLEPYHRHGQYPPYKALSYVWGRPRRIPPEILVNSHKVAVTTNLEVALRHLREQEADITLWIDALCINQSDTAERSSQVAQMREIYSTASEVIIFLGDGTDYSVANPHSYGDQRPFKKFGVDDADVSLASQYVNIWKTSSLQKPVQALEVFSFLIMMARYQGSSNPFELLEDIPEAHMTALSEALRRTLLVPWWDRIWVVQEAVVARNLTVRYSNVAISWELLVEVARVLSSWESLYARYPSSTPASDLKVFNLLSRVSDLDQFRKNWKESQRTDLLSLLQYFGHRKASDDRDRVYALIGLCNEATAIQPDYRLDVTQVYMAPILETIRNSRSLSVLYGDHSRKGRQDLPSWVPDWSTALDANERQRAALSPLYDACGGAIPILVTDKDSTDELIKGEMALLLDSLQAESNPSRLLREELASKLLCVEIRSTNPTRREITRICKALANYCHKDGRRDLPKYSLLRHNGQSLIVSGTRIGTVSKITEPLYSATDTDTAANILHGWEKVAKTRPVEYIPGNFLKTIVSDAKKTPDGFLRRLQAEDTAILEKWLTREILEGEDQHKAVESANGEFDQFTDIMRASTTKRTLFFINDGNDFYHILKKSLDTQETFLVESRKLRDQTASETALFDLLLEHIALLRRDRLLERGDFIKHDKDADYFPTILKRLFDTWENIFSILKKDFYPGFALSLIEQLDTQQSIIDTNKSYINGFFSDQHKLHLNRLMNVLTYDKTYDKEFFVEYERTGLGPMLIQEGDDIYILPGSSFPLVLRPVYRDAARKYQLVGDCFLNGIMDGESGSIGGNILDYIDYLDSERTKFVQYFGNPRLYEGKVGDLCTLEIV